MRASWDTWPNLQVTTAVQPIAPSPLNGQTLSSSKPVLQHVTPLTTGPLVMRLSRVHWLPFASKVVVPFSKGAQIEVASLPVLPGFPACSPQFLPESGGSYCNSWDESTQPLRSPSQQLSKVCVCQQKKHFNVCYARGTVYTPF